MLRSIICPNMIKHFNALKLEESTYGCITIKYASARVQWPLINRQLHCQSIARNSHSLTGRCIVCNNHSSTCSSVACNRDHFLKYICEFIQTIRCRKPHESGHRWLLLVRKRMSSTCLALVRPARLCWKETLARGLDTTQLAPWDPPLCLIGQAFSHTRRILSVSL